MLTPARSPLTFKETLHFQEKDGAIHPIHELPHITEADRELILGHASSLATYAGHSYKEEGRGFIRISMTEVIRERGRESEGEIPALPLDYIPSSALPAVEVAEGTRPLDYFLFILEPFIVAYDPDIDYLVAIVQSDGLARLYWVHEERQTPKMALDLGPGRFN